MRWIYTLIFYLAIPVILLRLLWRAWRAPAYARRWRERFGFIPELETEKKSYLVSHGFGGRISGGLAIDSHPAATATRATGDYLHHAHRLGACARRPG